MLLRTRSPRRDAVPAVAWTLLLALVVAACGGGEQERAAAPADTAATTDTAVAAAVAEQAPGAAAAMAAAEESAVPMEPVADFPHAPHKSLECARCHRTIPGHTGHGTAACTDCHTRPAGFASVPTPSRSECLACHHDPSRDRSCVSCHERPGLFSGRARVPLRFSVWDATRTRSLPFSHATHAPRSCDACHDPGTTHTPDRDCGACHAPHHRPDARCRTCHVRPDDATIHAGDAHRTCDGCHDTSVIATLPWGRETCLVCHAGQEQHEAPRRCLDCHPVTQTGAGVPGGGRP